MPYVKKRYRSRNSRINKNIKKYVQKTIEKNIETKQRDSSVSAQAVGDNTVSGGEYDLHLTALAQGDTQNQRQGNMILVTGFYSKYVVAVSDTTNILRFIVYIPHDPSTSTLANVDVHTLLDQDKYTVLIDRYVTVSAQGPASKIITLAKSFHRGARKGIKVKYDGTLSTDIANNRIMLYVVSDSTAISHPTITGSIRVYYKDG